VSAGEDPSSWASRLNDAEAAIEAREASADERDSDELRAIEEDWEKLAEERDALFATLDRLAAARDVAALDRDGRGSTRDQAARRPVDDHDPGFADRFLSGTDRDAAAGNRSDSADDRRAAAGQRERAGEDRRRSAKVGHRARAKEEQFRQGMETRNVIGQAQGMLMQRYDVSADEAFEMLVKLSQVQHVKLRDVARKLSSSGPL
jgi:hypothetical protein